MATTTLNTGLAYHLKHVGAQFFKSCYIMNKTRSSLLPENMDKLIFLTHNMKSVEGKLKA